MLMIVCDRQLNIKDEVLIDNVNPVWDIITAYKNKITLAVKPDIDEGDIILLKRDTDINFIGFVTEIKLDKGICEVNYYHISEIFNSEIPLVRINSNIYSWITFILYSNYLYSANISPVNSKTVSGTNSETSTIGSIPNSVLVKNIQIKPNTTYTISMLCELGFSCFLYNGLLAANGHNDTYTEIVYGGRGVEFLEYEREGNIFYNIILNNNYQYMAVTTGNFTFGSPNTYITLNFENIQVEASPQRTPYQPYLGYRDKLYCIPYNLIDDVIGSYSLPLEFGESGNFKQALDKVFNLSGTYLDYGIDFSNGKPSALNITVKNNLDTDYKIIRYDLPIISDVKINYAKQKYNKVVIIHKDETNYTHYRYLLKDGTITDDDTHINRFKNIFQTVKTYSEESEIEGIAKEALSGNESNHNIEFNILKNSSYDLKMYDRIMFFYKDQIFYSYVTRIEEAKLYKKITIGVIRNKMSQKLKSLMQY